MPTGWRPADVIERYPVYKIDDPYHFQKYAPEASVALRTWTWIQFLFTFALINYFFINIAKIGMGSAQKRHWAICYLPIRLVRNVRNYALGYRSTG